MFKIVFYFITLQPQIINPIKFLKMKKLSILFLSVLALGTTLTSCTKDESPASIVGKWQFNTMDGSAGTQTFAAGTKESLWSDGSCTTASYWQFDNGTGLHYGYYDPSNDCALSTQDVAYTIDSKNTTITIVTSKGNINYPIVKLTDKELSWREQASGTDADGNPFTVNIVHHMVKK
jgi:hypothetical protein